MLRIRRARSAERVRLRGPKPPKRYPWQQRLEDFQQFTIADQGIAKVSAKLVAEPHKVIERKNIVIVTLRKRGPLPLPKTLPEIPVTTTVYVAFISTKQWRKIKPYIAGKDKRLIVKGFPVLDKKLGIIAIYTQSLSSVTLDQEIREKQRAE